MARASSMATAVSGFDCMRCTTGKDHNNAFSIFVQGLAGLDGVAERKRLLDCAAGQSSIMVGWYSSIAMAPHELLRASDKQE